MNKRIIYSQHLLFRINLRKIPQELPRTIYKEAERLYFDKATQLYIAVKNIFHRDQVKTFMVAFEEENDIINLVTIHPLKKNQELNRIKSGRWQKL